MTDIVEGFLTKPGPNQTYFRDLGTPIDSQSLYDSDPIMLMDLVLHKQSRYRNLLNLTGDRAQKALDIMQKVVDSKNALESIQRSTLYAMMRLCKKSGAYSTCLTLKGVKCEEDHPVVFGRFGDIWRGSFGEQIVSMKTIRLNQQSQVDYLIKNFTREAILWSYLKHPNLLPFYGIYRMPEHRFGSVGLVSPWMNNGNMNDYLVSNPKIPRLPLVLDVVAGLQYLHYRKIMHGDLKPANILISSEGSALLADFGLSSVIDTEILRWTTVVTVTQTGGTIRYEAPEVLDEVEGELTPQPTFASDIYSLASVMYEVLTGKLPFYKFPRDATVMMQVVKGKIPRKPSDNSGLELTPEVWQIMERCWFRDPSRRPGIDRVAQALREAPSSILTQERITALAPKQKHLSNGVVEELAPDSFRSAVRGQDTHFSSADINWLLEMNERAQLFGSKPNQIVRSSLSRRQVAYEQRQYQTQQQPYNLNFLNDELDYFSDSDGPSDSDPPPPPPKSRSPASPTGSPVLEKEKKTVAVSQPASFPARLCLFPSTFRALPLLLSDLPTTRISVPRTFTWRDDKGRGFLYFVVIIDPALDSRIRSNIGKSSTKGVVVLPNLGDRPSESASINERKVVVESYLQSLVNLPVKYNEEVIAFLTSYIIRPIKNSSAQVDHKEGYLMKRGAKLTSWKKRYYLLCETGVLEYYEFNGSALLGSITITGAQIGHQQPVEEEKEHRSAFFIVEAQKRLAKSVPRRHVLCAESDKERDAWVVMLLKYTDVISVSARGAASRPPFCLSPPPLYKFELDVQISK